MGCTQSKAVAAPVPKVQNGGGDADPDPSTGAVAAAPVSPIKRSNSNRSFHSRSSHSKPSQRGEDTSSGASAPVSPKRTRSKINGGTSNHAGASSSKPKSPTPLVDSTWKYLWQTQPHPVDPADVPAVIAELMARQTNLLTPAEITMVQQRIRLLTTAKKETQQKKASRFRMSTETTVVEKQHAIDDFVLRKLWSTVPAGTPSNSEFQSRFQVTSENNNMDLVGSALVLLSHLAEPLWERAAQSAAMSAEEAGLEMDVNKNLTGNAFKMPPPPPPVDEYESADSLACDINFHSVCFLMALALRGTRVQRLQLLFYLLVAPSDLQEFLQKHPAGGIPSWLLEVDNDTVISLTSLAHYFYFGDTFLPTTTRNSSTSSRRKQDLTGALQVSSVQAMEMIASILSSSSSLQQNGSLPMDRRSSGSRHKKGSDASSDSFASNGENGASQVLSYIQTHQQLPEDHEQPFLENFWDVCEAQMQMEHNNHITWTMDSFYKWADPALDDVALDYLFQKVLPGLPAHQAERSLIMQKWQQWQQADVRFWTYEEGTHEEGTIDYLSHSFKQFFHLNDEQQQEKMPTAATRVWGGIGGFDGRGGLGHGIMYCVDKEWWHDWESYVGWNWEANMQVQPISRKRPGPISTERLIDHSEEAVVGGTLGSYELMKPGLVKDLDYVLVPPGVWDVLYELYGGGPALPRMVLPPPRMETRTRTFSMDSKQMEDEDVVSTDASVEVVAKNEKLLRVPEAFAVATHPLVIHCHVCDPQQPYRRGDAGPMSIRVMATPDQPLWRLYAEIIGRLPISNAKAVDKDGRGQARLWRQIEPVGPRDPSSRFGPWSLLCKNRSAIMPVANLDVEFEDSYDELKSDWRAYTDHATVEGIGLANGDRLMLEYAIQNKAGEFIWPREAAAKASRMRRLADEDLKFRRLLRGMDEDGKPITPPPDLVGMKIDAMDTSGRWFQVEILEVHVDEEAHDHDEEVTDGVADVEGDDGEPSKKKEIRVDFSEFGGHSEWIDIELDRLAPSGRFTLGEQDDEDSEATPASSKNGNDAKAKAGVALKKTTGESSEQNAGKVCTLPGYGACGLVNLGNTCYANSAIQCISYMPLLRSYLLSAQYKTSGDLNKDNPLGSGGKLLEEFAELLRIMWIGKYGERSPTRFRSQLGKATSQFSGADQQDAQEFLNYLLDVLHEDSNKIKKKPYVEALEDDWVKSNSLARVGDESWRRFLRRNRSVMADVAMGQVLNTVTCPVCNFSSRNFDPFNLLSLPFPTVADVVFVCTVVRRANPMNTPRVLNRPKKGDKNKKRRFDPKKLKADPLAPHDTMIMEQYAIAMSRLADVGDLKLRLQNISGIPANRLKLCKLEEIDLTGDPEDDNPVHHHQKVTVLPEKEGPCVQLARSLSTDEDTKSISPTRIIAFEKTLCARPPPVLENGGDHDVAEDRLTDEDDATTAEEDDEDVSINPDSRAYSAKDRRMIIEQMKTYGDKTECRLYDSDPLPIQKAVSRTLWPSTDKEFQLGLRVDAIDHREHWFPGSIVEILEGAAGDSSEEKGETVFKARVHFDNFSTKWDEIYEIDAFTNGQVQPLYAHATPRLKPTEFPVYHRYTDRSTNKSHLFGQSFYIQCPTEWSTARAGAHVLAQASRFLQKPEFSSHGPIDVDEVDEEAIASALRTYDKSFSIVNELIDILVDADREYVKGALGISSDGRDLLGDTFRNTEFDSNGVSTFLLKKVAGMIHKLPFEVRLVTIEYPCGGGKKGSINEEVPFPFSLMRTIGNFINARHAIALHWREAPYEKKYTALANTPVLYHAPSIAIHKSSADVLNESEAHASKNNPGSGGMDLGVCLTEFCKAQKLELSDCWRCPRCKEFREGKQHMDLWRLPDLLTFHIKRFNCSARWREKITTKVNFPLTGLDLSEWCHSESLCVDNTVYDLIGVMNHYGGMTGGHYVATCKATACGPDGREQVAYSFPGAGTSVASASDETDKVGWRLGGIRKEKEMVNQSKVTAAAAAKYASESAEPLWLQFDDELVEPIPPRNVVSEMAYVLFYRRRELSPANIAKYSTLD